MVVSTEKRRKGLLDRFLDALYDLEQCEDIDELPPQAYRLGDKKVRLPAAPVPLQLLLGECGKCYNLCPELLFNAEGELVPSDDYLVFDPEEYFSTITGFLRLQPGDDVTLGRGDPTLNELICFPDSIAERHLTLKIRENRLLLKRPTESAVACVAPLLNAKGASQIADWRRQKLRRISKLLPGPVAPLPKADAQELIDQALALFETEPHRPANPRGAPGGLVEIPDRYTPIIVGDLHAHIDNLLTILTQNGFLEAIEQDRACLVIIGDAVHREDDGFFEEMETSMQMMDIIFRLKLRFPDRVFYLRGNHDSFSEDVGKGGIPQGLLWAQELERVRGKKYKQTMERLYAVLPFAAISRELFTCHAGAPLAKVSREALIDIQQDPGLQRELTCNRLRKPNGMTGYTRSDVKKFRKRLGLDDDLPFIVGHTPLSMDDTLWLNVGEIPDHHVVYSGGSDWVGVLTRVAGRLLPLRYPVEPISGLMNRMDAAA